MQVPIQITFRNVEASEPIRAYVEKRAAKLESFFGRAVGCRVAIESPHRHKSHGHPYRVRIDLTVPGAELVAGHHSGDDISNTDVYAAIDVAFEDAVRLLHDHAGRIRAVRRRAESS